jgi:hypothetical protein
MAIEGSPKKFATDIAAGLVTLNKAVLRKYTPQDLKLIHSNLNVVLREVRAEFVEQSNFDAIKDKNIRMQRLNQAMMILSNYCKVYKITL